MAGRKRKNKYTIIILVLILLISGVVTYFQNKGNPEDENNTETEHNWAQDFADAGLLPGQTTASSDKGLTVEFIDVGQGDCTLIRCGNKNMLIDCGESEYYQVVKNYLKNNGISRLDIVVATHPHSDHIGGMYMLIEDFDIGTFIMPKLSKGNIPTTKTYLNMISSLKEKSLSPDYATVGKIYNLSDAEIEILAPVNDSDELNNMSVVCMLTYGKSKFLFTGDAETPVESDMIKGGADLKCNVLKVGHHGSTTSTGEKFLKKADPDVAVISVGEGNDYNHPHTKILDRLLKRDVTIYRTDEDGTLKFYVPSETADIIYP